MHDRAISFGLVAAVVCIGCRSAPAPRPMGGNAPQFGSSPAYSSLSKFVVGDWVEHFEPKDPSNPSMAERLAGMFQSTLSIRADSTFTYVFTTHKVTGAWSVFEDQLKLDPSMVDGRTLSKSSSMKRNTTQNTTIGRSLRGSNPPEIRVRSNGLRPCMLFSRWGTWSWPRTSNA